MTAYVSAYAVTDSPVDSGTHINRMNWSFRAITPDTDWLRIRSLNRAPQDGIATLKAGPDSFKGIVLGSKHANDVKRLQREDECFA
jgi:hypothetical protein